MSEEKLKKILKENLDEHICPLQFEQVWEKAQEKPEGRKVLKMKKLRKILVFAATLILAVGVGATANYEIRKDDVSYSFKNDQKVLGEWKTVDFVEEMEDFDPQNKANTDLMYLRGLHFRPSGRLQVFAQETGEEMFVGEGAELWSKGYINNYENEFKSTYKIKKIKGKEYLFYQWKSGDYGYSALDYIPYYVLERGTPTAVDFENRVMDDMTYSFVDDPALVGEWKIIDLVETKEQFIPTEVQYEGDLADVQCTGLVFEENGGILSVFGERKAPVNPGKWSKGYVVNERDMLRLEYEIREVDGEDYLFYERKNEDYVLGLSDEVSYSVLKRVE